jgi:hypothetical protein
VKYRSWLAWGLDGLQWPPLLHHFRHIEAFAGQRTASSASDRPATEPIKSAVEVPA